MTLVGSRFGSSQQTSGFWHAIVCLLTPRAGPKLGGRVAHTDATMFDRMAKSALGLSFVAILLAIAALSFRYSLLVLSPTGCLQFRV
jgi:hypothetical protein